MSPDYEPSRWQAWGRPLHPRLCHAQNIHDNPQKKSDGFHDADKASKSHRQIWIRQTCMCKSSLQLHCFQWVLNPVLAFQCWAWYSCIHIQIESPGWQNFRSKSLDFDITSKWTIIGLGIGRRGWLSAHYRILKCAWFCKLPMRNFWFLKNVAQAWCFLECKNITSRNIEHLDDLLIHSLLFKLYLPTIQQKICTLVFGAKCLSLEVNSFLDFKDQTMKIILFSLWEIVSF